MRKTLVGQADVKNALLGVQVATTKTGAVIDRLDYLDGILHVVVDNVTGTPTATEVTVKVQHSDTTTTGDFKDAVVNGEAIQVAVDAQGQLDINLEGLKQYVRVVANANFTGGTTPKADVVATLVLGNKTVNPFAE